MQAVDDSLDDHACDQFQIADPREDHGIDESGWGSRLKRSHWRRARSVGRGGYMPERGIGTDFINSSMTISDVTRSDSAWKLISTRWRRIGFARVRMYSKLTFVRPSISA